MSKLAILTPVFPYPRRGVYTGIERWVEGVSLGLKALGHEVDILTSFWNGGQESEIWKGVKLRRSFDLRMLSGRIAGVAQLDFLSLSFESTLKLLKEKPYDYVIYNMPNPFSRLIHPCKASATILHHLQPHSSLRDALTLPFGETYLGLTDSDIYVAPSNFTRESFLRKYKHLKGRTVVIPEGVDSRFGSGNPQRIREKLGTGPILLFVGNLTPSKGVLQLLGVFKRLHAHFPEMKLVYVGDGPLKPTLSQEAKELGLEKQVVLEGFVDDQLLPDYYAACDIFISLSTLEGFGLPFLEALKAGKPVVAFNTCSVPEIVGKAGLLLPLGDLNAVEKSLADLASNAHLSERIRELARERSSNCTWERTAKLLMSALDI